MVFGIWAGLAWAADEPLPIPAEEAAEEAPRYTNPGFGLGLTGVGAAEGDRIRYGLLLDFRGEQPVSRRLQLNTGLSFAVSRPENTVAVAQWGLDAGAWTTRAFGSVSRWVAAGRDTETDGLRDLGAMFAYFGLTISYAAVPIALVVSPLASIGHVVVGPTLSWHTSADTPNAYVEAGFGGVLFGYPPMDTPGMGCGPMLGAGTQLGRQTLGARLLVSPRGANITLDGMTGTLVTGSAVIGF